MPFFFWWVCDDPRGLWVISPVQFSSDPWSIGSSGVTRDDSAEILFTSRFSRRPLWAVLAWQGCPNLMLSIQHFLCRLRSRLPSKVPWRMVLERLSRRVTSANVRLLTVARRGSCGPTRILISLCTQSLVLCSKDEMRRIFFRFRKPVSFSPSQKAESMFTVTDWLSLAIAAIAEAILMRISAEQVPSLHRVAADDRNWSPPLTSGRLRYLHWYWSCCWSRFCSFLCWLPFRMVLLFHESVGEVLKFTIAAYFVDESKVA